jgi:predicted Ser/Thr protein kinase
MDRTGPIWGEFLSAFNVESATLLWQSTIDPFRRVYLANGYVYKVVALQFETSSYLRAHNLTGEFTVLQDCCGITGVPSPIAHHKTDDFEVLVLECLPGEPLVDINITWLQLLMILARLGIILLKLSWRGISHNDIVGNNILVTSNRSVSLIDFDQASRCTFFGGVLRQFLGIHRGGNAAHSSVITLVKEYLKRTLAPRVVSSLRGLRARTAKKELRRLPVLSEDTSFQLRTLLKAWKTAQISDANSPGQYLAYYSLSLNGYHFPGERPWSHRWNVLRSITNYNDKRILELGCNMALLSTFLLKYENAKAALAVDVDAKIIESAELIGLAFGVKPLLKIQNFDAPEDWETKLADFKPDIVFALNILNWVQDKKRFLNFLGQFHEVIFEGHDSFKVESEKLSDVGFKRINIIGTTERNRQVLHCRK